MKYLPLLILLNLAYIPSSASPLHSKLNHCVIIETDCENSDLRAIAILLNHNRVRVTAIVVSGDKIKQDKGIQNIRNLLSVFNADTIPVFQAVDKRDTDKLLNLVRKEKEKVSVIALGSGEISELIRYNESFASGIDDFIHSVEGKSPHLAGKVKERSYITEAGIHYDMITNLYPGNHLMDNVFIELYRKQETALAKAFLMISPEAGENELKPEELTALYLVNPELFSMALYDGIRKTSIVTGYDEQSIKDLLSDMITGRYKSGHFVALYGFPVNPELYTYDIRMIMDEAIKRYGLDEWKACVMTDEFHGHLGVYSIVGAKMGIRAREYFGIGTDLLSIISYAGSVTPFSCMSDGLQVSTGATLGQGTIRLAADSITKPQAIFTYKGKSIMVKLKPEYINQLREVIGKGVNDYGLEDEGYWNLVRQTSIRFWLEWDRNEIFELEEIDGNSVKI
jgi:pyrimidine-specific ribonucleoside hydrolase